MLVIVTGSTEKFPAITEHSRKETSSESAEEPEEIRGRPGRSASRQERSPDLNLVRQFLMVDNEMALS
jgi:hypothetical protein